VWEGERKKEEKKQGQDYRPSQKMKRGYNSVFERKRGE